MKKKKRIVMLLIYFQIFLCSCGNRDVNSTQSVLKGKNVIVYGDSIVWGQSGYEPSISRNPWPSVLAEKTGANVFNKGMPGSTLAFVGDDETTDLNRDSFVHLIESADLKEYDYIFIAYGTNDLSYGVPIGENDDMDTHTFKGAINYSLGEIQKKNPDIQIVLVTPMLDSRLNMSYCDAIVEMADVNDIMSIDMRNLKIGEDDLYDVYWDHKTQMHPTESTYYAMGCYISHFPNFKDVYCYKITYEPGGGYMDIRKSIAVQNERIGTMLTTCLQGYSFDGWYTEAEGGELITEDTLYSFEENIILYAHYTRR